MKCIAVLLLLERLQVFAAGIFVNVGKATHTSPPSRHMIVEPRGQTMVVEPNGQTEPPALAQQGQRARSTSKSFVSPIAGCEGLDCVKQYIALPDAAFTWHDTHRRLHGRDEETGVHWTGYVLNMTSQRWITENVVDFPVWWHTVVVVIPANLEAHTWATVHVEFGHNTMAGLRLFTNRDLSDNDNDVTVNSQTLDAALPELTAAVWSSVFMATRTRAVAVSLFNALNNYETFSNDPTHQHRYEDEIKAYTWIDFMTTGAKEPERIMELPVAKSVVRGMDVVSAFTARLPSGQVTQFGVYGHSKLGMATWMAGAVDSRVKAIAPTAMLMGLESLVPKHNPALLQQKRNPYEQMQFWRGTREIEKLYKIISPLNWMDKITVPKLVIMDTNDEWMDNTIPEVAKWWPELPEPKGLLFVKATHSTATVVTMPSAASFFRGTFQSTPMPRISYSFNQSSGKMLVRQRSGDVPSSVDVYYASSCNGDFPTPSFLDSQWEGASVWKASAPGSLRAYNAADMAEEQWTADLFSLKSPQALAQLASQRASGQCSRGGFLEVEFQWPEAGWPFKLSTPVFLVPL